MSLGKHNETRNKTSSTVKNLKKKKYNANIRMLKERKFFRILPIVYKFLSGLKNLGRVGKQYW